MANENLSKNSVDESIPAIENNGKVKEQNNTLPPNQIQRTKKLMKIFSKI